LICDIIITVFADINTKILRVIDRDSSTKKEVLNRMKNQWQEDKIILQSNYIIYNELLDETKWQVNKIHNILTKKAQNF
jgi:dephospho-CoA kinase